MKFLRVDVTSRVIAVFGGLSGSCDSSVCWWAPCCVGRLMNCLFCLKRSAEDALSHRSTLFLAFTLTLLSFDTYLHAACFHTLHVKFHSCFYTLVCLTAAVRSLNTKYKQIPPQRWAGVKFIDTLEETTLWLAEQRRRSAQIKSSYIFRVKLM